MCDLKILNNVFFEYHQTISGCCIYRPYDPAFETEDYKWTDKIPKGREVRVITIKH